MFKIQVINTLTLDLPHTDLADFAEHFERQLERRPSEIIQTLPASSLGKFDDVAFDDLPPERQRLLQLEGMTLVRIKRTIEGASTRRYSVIVFQKVLFRLTIERFRRDRLRLVYEERLGPLRYAKSFLGWLTPRFGDPIYHVNLDLTPILREPPTEIGLILMETWVAELTAMGVSESRMMNELGLDPKALKRYRRNIAQKAKAHLQITRDLQPGELDDLLRELGYGVGAPA